jgi:hypothetical protein
MILRNRGENLESSFTAVGEAFKDPGSIESVKALPVACSDPFARPVGMSIEVENGRHVVISSLKSTGPVRSHGLKFTGKLLAMTLNNEGELLEVFMDGSYLERGSLIIRGKESLEGKVESIEPENSTVTVRMGNWVKPEVLVGKRAFFRNRRRASSFKILEARKSKGLLALRLESNGKLGRLKVEKSGDREVTTGTELILSGYGYYEGTHLVDSKFDRWIEIIDVENGRIRLDGDLKGFAFPNAFVWEFGPGDDVTIGTEISIKRSGRGLTGRTNIPVEVVIGEDVWTREPGRFALNHHKPG